MEETQIDVRTKNGLKGYPEIFFAVTGFERVVSGGVPGLPVSDLPAGGIEEAISETAQSPDSARNTPDGESSRSGPDPRKRSHYFKDGISPETAANTAKLLYPEAVYTYPGVATEKPVYEPISANEVISDELRKTRTLEERADSVQADKEQLSIAQTVNGDAVIETLVELTAERKIIEVIKGQPEIKTVVMSAVSGVVRDAITRSTSEVVSPNDAETGPFSHAGDAVSFSSLQPVSADNVRTITETLEINAATYPDLGGEFEEIKRLITEDLPDTLRKIVAAIKVYPGDRNSRERAADNTPIISTLSQSCDMFEGLSGSGINRRDYDAESISEISARLIRETDYR